MLSLAAPIDLIDKFIFWEQVAAAGATSRVGDLGAVDSSDAFVKLQAPSAPSQGNAKTGPAKPEKGSGACIVS